MSGFHVGFAEEKGFAFANYVKEIRQFSGLLCSTLWPLILAYAQPAMETGSSEIPLGISMLL